MLAQTDNGHSPLPVLQCLKKKLTRTNNNKMHRLTGHDTRARIGVTDVVLTTEPDEIASSKLEIIKEDESEHESDEDEDAGPRYFLKLQFGRLPRLIVVK